jgi:rare lipoprotein A (peptidoglycan hydrolase)
MIRPIFVAMALACTSTSAFAETCISSHYGYSGGRTASGERMNPSAMTAAHRTRPFVLKLQLPRTQADEASLSESMTAVHS